MVGRAAWMRVSLDSTVFDRYVEVDPHQDFLAFYIEIGNQLLVEHGFLL